MGVPPVSLERAGMPGREKTPGNLTPVFTRSDVSIQEALSFGETGHKFTALYRICPFSSLLNFFLAFLSPQNARGHSEGGSREEVSLLGNEWHTASAKSFHQTQRPMTYDPHSDSMILHALCSLFLLKQVAKRRGKGFMGIYRFRLEVGDCL